MHRQKACLIYQNGFKNKPDFFLLNLGLDPRHFKPAWQASKREGKGVKKDRRGRDSRFSPSPFPFFCTCHAGYGHEQRHFLSFLLCLFYHLKELDNHFKQYQLCERKHKQSVRTRGVRSFGLLFGLL